MFGSVSGIVSTGKFRVVWWMFGGCLGRWK